jgi:glycerol-1-phosphate dehydrogenase [NAD(P)+]
MLCQQVYDMVEQQIAICRKDLPAVNRRDEHAIARLMEALVAVGFCMSYVGNSRPASGSEHHLSHFFEVIGLLNKQPYFPHGIDVAYSTAVTCALRHRLVHGIQRAGYGPMNQEKWQERVQAVYGTLAPKIIALQNRVGFYGDGREERQARIRKLWPQLQSVLAEVPEENEMAALLEELGAIEELDDITKLMLRHQLYMGGGPDAPVDKIRFNLPDSPADDRSIIQFKRFLKACHLALAHNAVMCIDG